MINLYVGYYEDPNPRRNTELLECVHQNINNPYINYVIIESQDRLKYNDFFKFINEYSLNTDVNVIANLDIYLDYSTCHFMNKIKPKEVFALCRWDKVKNGSIRFANRPDSQDTWVFRGHITGVDCDFHLGYAGCDNRVARVFSDAKWKVSNPSKTIKTIHVHNSNIRNYRVRNKNTLVVKGKYLTLPPTDLNGV
ncbi:MAG: hypothetical protein ACFFG0_27280 [Candidatus Thorarchaeota archaeon]